MQTHRIQRDGGDCCDPNAGEFNGTSRFPQNTRRGRYGPVRLALSVENDQLKQTGESGGARRELSQPFHSDV